MTFHRFSCRMAAAAACSIFIAAAATDAHGQGLLRKWRDRKHAESSVSEQPPTPAAEAAFDASKGYKLEPGPYAAAEFDLDLTRKDGSKLPLTIRFPKQPEIEHHTPLPLVIFSHGAGGSSDAFPSLTEHLATHGYVVILPTHRDSIKLRRQAGENIRDLSNPSYVIKGVKPFERVEDCTLILDSLATIEASMATKMSLPEGFKPDRLIDREKMGIAGHSAGAMTAQLSIGAKARSLDSLEPRSYAEPRFKSAVLISGQGTKTRMFTEQSWSEIDRPMLVITGSLDTVESTRDTPQSRREPFEFAKPGEKYLVYIEGATHSSYTGNIRPRDRTSKDVGDAGMIERVTNSAVHAFLDATLLKLDEARNYLAGDRLIELSLNKAEFKRK